MQDKFDVHLANFYLDIYFENFKHIQLSIYISHDFASEFFVSIISVYDFLDFSYCWSRSYIKICEVIYIMIWKYYTNLKLD